MVAGGSVVIVPAAGGTPTPLAVPAGGTSWSPDGMWISVGEYGNEQLYIAAADGSEVTLHGARAPGYTRWAPSVFPGSS